MKKLFLVSLFIFCSIKLFAGANIDVSYTTRYSTFTQSSEIGRSLTGAVSLCDVIVSSASTGGSLELYDSIGSTTSRQIDLIDLSVAKQNEYDIKLSSGLTYTTSGNSKGVVIIYQK